MYTKDEVLKGIADILNDFERPKFMYKLDTYRNTKYKAKTIKLTDIPMSFHYENHSFLLYSPDDGCVTLAPFPVMGDGISKDIVEAVKRKFPEAKPSKRSPDLSDVAIDIYFSE